MSVSSSRCIHLSRLGCDAETRLPPGKLVFSFFQFLGVG
jgi:hypothetical protein